MRRLLQACVIVLAAAASSPAVAQQAPDNRPGVAVLPFHAGAGPASERESMEALSIGVQQILITELTMNSGLRLVDRAVIRDLMAEQDLGAAGRLDPETAARIGRMVGAKYVVTGGFNEMTGMFHVDGRIVDVETSEILKADRVSERRNNMYRAITGFGNRITDGVNLPPLARPVRQQQDARANQTPPEAIVLYSQAHRLADQGRKDEARELFRRITVEFPQSTTAQEALRQISGG
jgi:TolB-like protein